MLPAAGTRRTSSMAFSAEWLELREPVDLAARDDALLSRAAACVDQDAVVLDLGSGTGSMARAFSHKAHVGWTWRFVDADTALLKVAHARYPGAEYITMNLRDIDELPLESVALVTASALLDLMPADWMARLAARLMQANIPFYAALNYDGVMAWMPPLETDAAITDAFNQHQQTDKGIGPAMGPRSGQLAAEILTEHGFDVTLANSPWRLDAAHADLQRQLVAGIGEAAQDIGNPVALQWVQQRQADMAQSRAVIGHTDLLAIPREMN